MIEVLHTLNNLTWSELLTYLGIIALFGLFGLQVFAYTTPRNPKKRGGVFVFLGVGVTALFLFLEFLPIFPSIVNACIHNVYGWTGFIYLASLVTLLFVMVYNTLDTWGKNKPLQLVR